MEQEAEARRDIAAADLVRYHGHALALAEESRRRLRAFYAGGFAVKRKPDGSYVTDADLQVEQRLRAMVESVFPDHGIIGEEYEARRPAADFQWIFDPVDGTEDFVQRVPTFGTVIALHYRGDPLVSVIDMPMLEVRVHGAFGRGVFLADERLRLADLDPATPGPAVRVMLSARANFVRYRDDGALFDAVTRAYPNHRIYRSCYTHLCAITGQADATIDAANPIWDIAATRLLIEEAGGLFQVVQDYRSRGEQIFTTVFGRRTLVRRLAALLRDASSPGT